MYNQELESRIKSAYDDIAPDILGSVLSDCDTQKGQIIIMQKNKKNRSLVKYIAGMAAALLLVIGGMAGMNTYQVNHAIASTIMLDVNPSIEIQVNKSEKVLDVKALNEDAKIVVGDMDFSGSNLDVAVNALIGSMLRNGYISDAANSILVTVGSNDAAAGQEMQARLMSEINSILESGNVSGAVLGQTVTNDSEIQKLAEKYGITVGKAKLIKQIAQQNKIYSFADLVPLTINELNLISGSGEKKLENIESIGTASSSAYIGEQAARDAAFEHAGINAEKATKVKCELDWENGMMTYEVEFKAGGYEYDYDINAVTGEIVKCDKETDDDHAAQKQTDPASGTEPKQDAAQAADESTAAVIGASEAKKIALNHAKVSDIRDYECELDRERGKAVYEISFEANGCEYDYEIDAVSGAIIKAEKETDDDHLRVPSSQPDKDTSENDTSVNKPSAPAQTYIGESSAKSAAYKHAGVKESDVYDCSCELDREQKISVYEVEFKAGGYEYDYDINAVTGEVVKCDKEIDDDHAAQKQTDPASGTEPKKDAAQAADESTAAEIGASEAKKIALNHAKVSDIRDYECELDRERGKAVYEISFEANGCEYDYEIDAVSGAIIKAEKETD